MPPFSKSELADPRVLTCAAAEMYAMRRRRDRLIPGELVGEPAWDILLRLYARHPSPVPLRDLSDGSDAGAIAERWVAALGARSFTLCRKAPAGDEMLVSLTSEGHKKMAACLRAMLQSPSKSAASDC